MPSARVELSVILPAYNEARRMPPYLSAVRAHLEDRYPHRHEVIVVDDGSDDGLAYLLEKAAADWPQLRWISHPENQGKGAAVRTGMLAAAGDRLLFADADGATPIDEETRLSAAIEAGADVAIGSRLAPGAVRSRAWFRGLAGRAFASLARRTLGLSVRDTQCGFKMFRGDVGHKLFKLAEESRYLFDLEILALAEGLGYRVAEVPIRWQEIPGGHLRLSREARRILWDLRRIRRRVRARVANTTGKEDCVRSITA